MPKATKKGRKETDDDRKRAKRILRGDQKAAWAEKNQDKIKYKRRLVKGRKMLREVNEDLLDGKQLQHFLQEKEFVEAHDRKELFEKSDEGKALKFAKKRVELDERSGPRNDSLIDAWNNLAPLLDENNNIIPREMPTPPPSHRPDLDDILTILKANKMTDFSVEFKLEDGNNTK